MIINVRLSGLIVGFDTQFPDYVRERCRDYLVDESLVPDLILTATEENIRIANRENVGEREAELFAMTIPLSEQLPLHDRLMTHGVAISCDGRGYIFTAESGVGKSTHAFLWQRYLGRDRVQVVNGDKPILWFQQDGRVAACGTPWSGKEGLDINCCVPIAGVCLLSRGAPHITPSTRQEAFDFLMHQTFLPHNPQAMVRTFQLIERLYDNVPIYNLTADMSREAVMTSYDQLTKPL